MHLPVAPGAEEMALVEFRLDELERGQPVRYVELLFSLIWMVEVECTGETCVPADFAFPTEIIHRCLPQSPPAKIGLMSEIPGGVSFEWHPLDFSKEDNLAQPSDSLYYAPMPTETKVFSGHSFKLIQSGQWQPESFGVVDVEIVKTENKLEVFIDSNTEVPIQFEIDSYLWTGKQLLLRTKDKVRWILQATN